jgi:ribosomal protein S4E
MFKHNNFNGNGFNGAKPFKQRNVKQYRGSVNANTISNENFVETAAFQINRFKDCINLRFNDVFLKQLLDQIKHQAADIMIAAMLNDIEDIISEKNNECFVSEAYHIGRVGKCIYINMNNDCGLKLYDLFNSLNSFPPYILAFKQRLEKLCLQSKNYGKEFEENYNS